MNTVVLEVGTLTDTLANVAQAMDAGHAETEAHISFATPELLWQVLTAKRWDLIKALCNVGPVSVSEAARRVGGDLETVSHDVTALLNAGVLTAANDGKVEFPFDTVRVEFVLKAA